MKQYLLSLLIITITCNCKKASDKPALPFASTPTEVAVKPGVIDEVSGIADSKINNGFLWVHEDSGNPTEITLLKWDGSVFKKIFIKGATNRDWEDMAIAPGPSSNVNYIYIADIGDNNAIQNNYSIYRFAEPNKDADTVYTPEKIVFKYTDGAHDAEAIMVDNITKDIYIITKRDAQSKVYKITYPQSITTSNTATLVATLPFNGVVGAAFSANTNEIILKTYTHLYYWKRNAGETIEQTLKRSFTNLAYKVEPQGEAVAFKNDGSGFFTLSEIGLSNGVFLNFYKRL